MSEIRSISTGTYTIGQTSNLNFEAGTGIKITEPSEGTVRIANDETVLWTGTLTVGNSAIMSEPVSGFERYKIYLLGYERKLKVVDEFWTDGSSSGNEPYKVCPIIFQAGSEFFTINAGDCKWNESWNILQYVGGYNKWMPSNSSTWNWLDANTNSPTITKVIGINRISGGSNE